MITSEKSVTYKKKIGNVVFVIKSESKPDTRLDMVDAIVVLIKRDLEHGDKPPENN